MEDWKAKKNTTKSCKHIKKMVEDVLERHMFESSGIAKKGDAKP